LPAARSRATNLPGHTVSPPANRHHLRYEIAASAPDWIDAEQQVQRTLTQSTKGKHAGGATAQPAVTVSVKSAGRGKRKGEAATKSAAEVWEEEIGATEAKRLKMGMRKARD
jgi:hypothetical protein